jgi:hypothetical protein
MLGQTVARILLVITLIVTAHAIKPFSAKNITSHLLYLSRSLAVILPDSARSGFDHANQLALTLSDSLFSDKQTGPRWSNETSARSGSIAINPKPSTDITSNEIGAPIKKARTSMRRQFIAVNSAATSIDSDLIEMTGIFNTAEAAGGIATGGLTPTAVGHPEAVSEPRPAVLKFPRELPAATPLALPVIRLKMDCALLKRIQPIRLDRSHLRPPMMWRIYEPKKSGCDKSNGKQSKLIAFLEVTKEKLRFDRVRVERSIFTMLECEEEDKEVTTEEDSAAESQELNSYAQEFDGISVSVPQQYSENCTYP